MSYTMFVNCVFDSLLRIDIQYDNCTSTMCYNALFHSSAPQNVEIVETIYGNVTVTLQVSNGV